MIRAAKRLEISKLITITRACAAKMTSVGIYQWDENYPNEAAFQKDLQRNELFVRLENDSVVGCITISTHKDEEYNTIDWLTPDAHNFYIHRLAVAPAHQHQGHAKQLMDFAENHALENNAISVRLDTFSKNKRNQRFYEARNYQKLGDVYFPRQTKYPFHCYELVF